MKRIVILVLCAVLLAAAGLFYYLRFQRHDIVITQKQIDEVLQKNFPISKTYMFLFELTYANPRATLLPESDRVEIGLDAELEIKLGGDAKKFTGTAVITSSIGYRDETKQLFLVNPEITKLSLPGIPQKYLDKATTFASDVGRDYVKQIPIFTVKGTDTASTAAKLLVRDVQVKTGAIYIKLGL